MAVDSNPSCYGWYDEKDPSCRKCGVMGECKQQQGESRPACFAELYDADHPECMKCLDNSSCAEESIKMAAPKIRIKRPMAAAVAEPEEVEEVVATEEATVDEDVDIDPMVEEDESPYDEMSITDMRAELENRGLDSTGRRSVLIERLEADDAKPVVKKAAAPAKTVAVAPKPAPVAAPKPVAVAKPAPVAPVIAPKPIPQPEVVDDGGAADLGKTTLSDVMKILRDGESLVLSKEGNSLILSLSGKGVAAPSPAKSTGPKLKGDAYWQEVLSTEYFSWYYDDAGNGKPWGEMSAEEKEELCDILGIEYEHADDPRINAVHMVKAIMEHLKIRKYKPEYEKAAARDALKA